MNKEYMIRYSAALKALTLGCPTENGYKLGNGKDEFELGIWHVGMGCGTAACAIGWMPELMPDSPLTIVNRMPCYQQEQKNAITGKNETVYTYSWRAVTEALRIDNASAEWLFSLYGYAEKAVMPADVAGRLDMILALVDEWNANSVSTAVKQIQIIDGI